MDQKQFERLLAGEYASQQPQIAEPNRIGRSGYQSEAALRETVQLTPEERLLDQQTNANPAVFAELEREIRNARDPKARAVLEQELARQKSGGQVAPAQNLIRPTWVADESLPDFGKARRRADAQAKADESPISTQLGRGVKTLAHNVGLLKDTLLDDSEGAAQRIVEKRKYDEENPQPTSVQDFTKDWNDLSDDDYLGMAKTFLKNPSGTFGMMVEQTPNSIPGLAANIAALGLTAFNPAMGFATKAAIQGIASLAGNLGPEGGAVIEERLQKAGVDPDNHAQLAQWLKDNRADNLVAGVSKAGVISVADAVTANLGAKLMAGPSMRFANAEREFLTSKGVDLKDAAKIRAARATDDYKATMQPFAKDVADATGKAQLFGRAVGSTLLDAAGEGGGEYLGSLAAHGEASVKDAVLEGVMGVGQGTAMAGAGYALGKLSGPDATEQEIRKLAEYQAKQQAQQPDPQPNSPLSNAAQAATPVDPFAEALAPITARLNDRDLFAKIRGTDQLGPNAMSDILASYRVATNPTLDPMRRQAAVDRLNEFFTAFDSMPNFTFGNAQQDSAQPVSNLPAAQSAPQGGPVGFADPSVGSINGEARVVSDPVPIGGQRRLPAPPRRLSAPPPALIADNREAQRIVAEYEAAYQDLVKADQLGASDQELMQRQVNLRNAEARLNELNQIIESSRVQESAKKRDALLSDVLASLPPGQNPMRAFDRALKQAGFTDTSFTDAEKAKISRFVELSGMQEEQQPSPVITPNEGGDFGIKEKIVSSTPATKTVADLVNSGWKWDGGWNLSGPKGEVKKLKGGERQFLKNHVAKVRAENAASGISSARNTAGNRDQEAGVGDAGILDGGNRPASDGSGGVSLAGAPDGAVQSAVPVVVPDQPGNSLTQGEGSNDLSSTEQVAEEAVQANDAQVGAEPAAAPEAERLAKEWDRANRTGRNVEWQVGAAESNPAFNAVEQEGVNVPAHGMAKSATLGEALKNLVSMLNGGIDPNRTLYYDQLTNPSHQSGGATAGGHAYRDGPFIITFREGLNGRQPTAEDITGVLVNPAHSELVGPLQQMFPSITIRDFNGVADVISASTEGEKSSASQANDAQVGAEQTAAPAGEVVEPWKQSLSDFIQSNDGVSERRATSRWAGSVYDAWREGKAVSNDVLSEVVSKAPNFAPDHMASKDVLLERHKASIDKSLDNAIWRAELEHKELAKKLDYKAYRVGEKRDELYAKLRALHDSIEAMKDEQHQRNQGRAFDGPFAMQYLSKVIDAANGISQSAPATEEVVGSKDENWLKELFGNGDNVQGGENLSPAKPANLDLGGLVNALRDFSNQKLAEANDWAGRQYKENKQQVTFSGDGPSRQESMSVSAVNESRRRRNVESLQKQAQLASNLANRIERGHDVSSEVSQAIRNADSDIQRDGKPRFGKTREEQVEAYISNSLLGDDYYGFGEGTVSNLLRKAYESNSVQSETVQAEPAAVATGDEQTGSQDQGQAVAESSPATENVPGAVKTSNVKQDRRAIRTDSDDALTAIAKLGDSPSFEVGKYKYLSGFPSGVWYVQNGPISGQYKRTDLDTNEVIKYLQDNGWTDDRVPETIERLVIKADANHNAIFGQKKTDQKASDVTAQEPAGQQASGIAEYVDTKVGDILADFESGNFDTPSNVTAASKEFREEAKRQTVLNHLAYSIAAQKFVEGDLKAKPPGARDPYLNLEFLENLRPNPLAKKIAKVKDLQSTFKALFEIAPEKDIRYYLNGIHFDESGELVVTDGHRIAVVSGVDTSSVQKSDKGFTVQDRDGKWVDGLYPDWRRVMPESTGVREVFDSTRLGDQVRAVMKAARYTAAPKDVSTTPLTIRVGDESITLAASYVADMADTFRRFGYDTFEMSATVNSGMQSIIGESPDGKVRQRVMAKKDVVSPFATIGKDGYIGESRVTHPDYDEYLADKSSAAIRQKPEPTKDVASDQPLPAERPIQESIQQAQEGPDVTPNYKAGDRITPDHDVIEGDVVKSEDGKLWMAKVKRGISMPVLPIEGGKPVVNADVARRFDLTQTVVTHTGMNVYGYGGQPKIGVSSVDQLKYESDGNADGPSKEQGAKAFADGKERKAPEFFSAAEKARWFAGYDEAQKASAKKPENRENVERSIVDQLKKQWSERTADGFIIGQHYPATVTHNGVTRKIGLFKRKGSGVLYAESLDKTIYGPVFTQYKVDGDKLVEVGTRNLFGRDASVANEQVAKFEALFERASDEKKKTSEDFPSGEKYKGPADVSSRAGQMEMANRAGTIAALKAMNSQLRKIAPDEAWSDANIEDATDLDSLRDRISQALVDAQRGNNADADSLRKTLREMSGQDLKDIFEILGLAGSRMMHSERVDALMEEDESEVRAAIDRVLSGDSTVNKESDAEFTHNGVRIYPVRVNVGGEPKSMWGVESFENKAKREAGERHGFGDGLHDTVEQAKYAADRMIRDQKEQAEFDERQRAKEADERAQKEAIDSDTINGFLDGKAPNQKALIRKALDKLWRFDGDAVMSARQRVESLLSDGRLEVSTREENKIKPMSRSQFNRASQREQDAHEKKMREAGTKTVYLVSGSDLGKTAYDYAQHLLGKQSSSLKQNSELGDVDFKARLKKYNDTLQSELDRGVSIDAAHQQALGMAGLTGDGLLKARSMLGLPATSRPGTWWVEEGQDQAVENTLSTLMIESEGETKSADKAISDIDNQLSVADQLLACVLS